MTRMITPPVVSDRSGLVHQLKAILDPGQTIQQLLRLTSLAFFSVSLLASKFPALGSRWDRRTRLDSFLNASSAIMVSYEGVPLLATSYDRLDCINTHFAIPYRGSCTIACSHKGRPPIDAIVVDRLVLFDQLFILPIFARQLLVSS